METYLLRRGTYKNLTLRVLPPDGQVRVSAPRHVPKAFVDQFVSERAAWIAKKRAELATLRPSGAPGSLPVWGQVFPLRVESPGKVPRVLFDPSVPEVILRVPPLWDGDQQRKALERWEGDRVAAALDVLVPRWAHKMGLKVDRWTVKRMRSRWGSCRPDTRSLVFNARLGAFSPRCLEYVVVHELVHLVEPSHNARFHALVESWLPEAQEARGLLKKGSSVSDFF